MNTMDSYDRELSTHVVTPDEVRGIPKGKEAEYAAQCAQLKAEVEAYESGPRHERSSDESKEVLARVREDNINGSKSQQFYKQDELAKIRQGQILHCLEILRRINKLIPAKFTGMSKYGMMALRCLVPTANGGEWQFICGVPAGYLHEYSTMHINEHGVATSEMYRGWRTVLLRLLQSKCVTDEQLNKLFGRASGPESWRYLEMVQHIRNEGRN